MFVTPNPHKKLLSMNRDTHNKVILHFPPSQAILTRNVIERRHKALVRSANKGVDAGTAALEPTT